MLQIRHSPLASGVNLDTVFSQRISYMRQRAFTLIELLVVVGIIAVLIAVLIPSLAAARDHARLTVCQTRMRAWGQGFNIYESNYDNFLPADGGDGTSAASGGKPIGRWDDNYMWWNGLTLNTKGGDQTYYDLQTAEVTLGTPLPKGSVNSLFLCPSAVLDAAPGGTGATADQVANGYFRTVGWKQLGANLTEQTRDMLLCYGYNSQIRKTTMSSTIYPPRSDPGDITKLTQLDPGSSTVIIAEKRIRPDELPITDPNYDKALAQNKVAPTRFAARHKNGGNITFADGHVEYWKNADVTSVPSPYNQPGLIWTPGL